MLKLSLGVVASLEVRSRERCIDARGGDTK